MNILLLGSGGREHALAWKLQQSPALDTLFIAPGNGGTATLGTNIPLTDAQIPEIVDFAKTHDVDLVIPGPELPLVLGIKEALEKTGISCFGPDSFCAQLEGSKVFAKNLMQKIGIPTAPFRVFTDLEKALTALHNMPLPIVIKADGLAAGKGVVIAKTYVEAETALRDMLEQKIFGASGETVILEEALEGEEASFLAFCDGETAVAMPSLQDHKRVGDNDTGPNTGGMGAYCPAPLLPAEQAETMLDLCIRPVLRAMAAAGHPFTGVLYAGLMFTKRGPYVLEYNVRFGDPECQPLMALLETDLLKIATACTQKNLQPNLVRFAGQSSCCVVMTAPGYPGPYPKGMPITGLNAAEKYAQVFQAGTRQESSHVLTNGGRVLSVIACAPTLTAAQEQAYKGVNCIHFEGAFFRKDIGAKALRP